MKSKRTASSKLAPVTRRKRGKPFLPGNTEGVEFRFPKGVSGNPEGRVKYKVPSEAARALLAAPIPDDPDGRLFAEGICDTLGWMALMGDRGAAETLFDRAEGRPRQSISVNDPNGDPLADLIAEFRAVNEKYKAEGTPK